MKKAPTAGAGVERGKVEGGFAAPLLFFFRV